MNILEQLREKQQAEKKEREGKQIAETIFFIQETIFNPNWDTEKIVYNIFKNFNEEEDAWICRKDASIHVASMILWNTLNETSINVNQIKNKTIKTLLEDIEKRLDAKLHFEKFTTADHTLKIKIKIVFTEINSSSDLWS